VKFLVDNALPPMLAELLLAAGHDSVHIRTYGMQAETDDVILARAMAEDRIIVSADTDSARFSRTKPQTARHSFCSATPIFWLRPITRTPFYRF
jgi:predicted nuclease of predicted toxin-antitoxin system